MTKPALFACLLALTTPACNNLRGGGGGGANVTLETDEQKTLYALGLIIGQRTGISNLKLSESDLKYVKAGFSDAAQGVKPRVELEQYGPKVNQLTHKRATARAEGEKKKGEEFAAKAAKEPGAEQTASGLVYKELTPGKGDQPKATDVVKVNYKGTLIDGTEFDSSYKRGQPVEFPLQSVIPCWTEGVQKMKVGGKAKLVCPSKIAYGDNGRPPTIPGGATLVFEIELLDIKHGPQMPQLSVPRPSGAHTAPAKGAKTAPAKK
jgi:FKBP-type peptidyl-prolyl cis-trans isomerase FkpA